MDKLRIAPEFLEMRSIARHRNLKNEDHYGFASSIWVDFYLD